MPVDDKLVRLKLEDIAAHPLRSLFFELTDACNLNCLHCGSHCSPAGARYMDVALVGRALDAILREMGAPKVFIVLTGGEPLLHPRFFEIAEHIASRGFYWGMTTNATLIDDDVAEKLLETRLTSVSFSLDGPAEAHAKLRASRTAYQRAVDGIRCAMRHFDGRVTTMITAVIYRENIGNLEQAYAEARELAVDYWRPINVEPIGRANQNPELFLDKEGYRVLLDFIRAKHLAGEEPEVVYGCSHALPDLYVRSVRDHYFHCVSGVSNASILVNGDIYGCLDIERRPELVQGNLYHDDFFTVWRDKFEVFRRDRSECDYCAGCADRAFCRGDSAHTWDYDNNRPLLCLRKLFAGGDNA